LALVECDTEVVDRHGAVLRAFLSAVMRSWRNDDLAVSFAASTAMIVTIDAIVM
jgi:hypothetical protein